jgi:hypothetical protein
MGESSWAVDEIGVLSVHPSIAGEISGDVVSGGYRELPRAVNVKCF